MHWNAKPCGIPVRPPTDVNTLRILVDQQRRLEGKHAICFGLETIMHAAKAITLVLDDMHSGRFALRASITNFRATRRDIRVTLDAVRRAAREGEKE